MQIINKRESRITFWNNDKFLFFENKDFRASTFDTEIDLYYYGYRYFDPETDRWLNRDPLEEEGGINLY